MGIYFSGSAGRRLVSQVCRATELWKLALYYGGCPLSRNFPERTHVKSTRVNKTEAMYESPRVKVERGSTFSGTREIPYITSVVFRRVKVRCVRTLKLRENPPLSSCVLYGHRNLYQHKHFTKTCRFYSSLSHLGNLFFSLISTPILNFLNLYLFHFVCGLSRRGRSSSFDNTR